MKLLLHTHALLWWCDGDAQLSKRVRAVLEDESNEVLVSAASVWEIATKARLGKLPRAITIAQRLPDLIVEQGFRALSITVAHSQQAGWLPGPHRDPFDRMLAAQAQIESLPLATQDPVFKSYGVQVFW